MKFHRNLGEGYAKYEVSQVVRDAGCDVSDKIVREICKLGLLYADQVMDCTPVGAGVPHLPSSMKSYLNRKQVVNWDNKVAQCNFFTTQQITWEVFISSFSIHKPASIT
jgi:hypothetical protein